MRNNIEKCISSTVPVTTAYRTVKGAFDIILKFSSLLIQTHFRNIKTERTEKNIIVTRTVRKSDNTPALALPKHMTGIFDEKCREKEKGSNPINPIIQQVIVNLQNKFRSLDTHCLCYSVYLI